MKLKGKKEFVKNQTAHYRRSQNYVTIRPNNLEICKEKCNWQTSAANTHSEAATGSSDPLEQQQNPLKSYLIESDIGKVSLNVAERTLMKMEIYGLEIVQQQHCNKLTALAGKWEHFMFEADTARIDSECGHATLER